MTMENTEKIQLKKGDYFILLAVLFMVIIAITLILGKEKGNVVHVTIGDESTTYAINENQRIPVGSAESKSLEVKEDFITNMIVIEDGQVFMEHATCPDQICVNHKPIFKNGEMIICLPNKVYVEVESDIANEIDN